MQRAMGSFCATKRPLSILPAPAGTSMTLMKQVRGEEPPNGPRASAQRGRGLMAAKEARTSQLSSRRPAQV